MKMNGKKSGIVFYKIGLEDNIVIGRNINGYVIKEFNLEQSILVSGKPVVSVHAPLNLRLVFCQVNRQYF